jgi:hypothetical protein
VPGGRKKKRGVAKEEDGEEEGRSRIEVLGVA